MLYSKKDHDMPRPNISAAMLDLPSLITRLGGVSHFSHMSDVDRTRIVTAGQVRFYPAGSMVFEEGGDCAGLFVLFSGRVNMCKLGLQGQETIISVIRPVIMFNEVAVLDGGPNPLSAMAVMDCATWRLSHESFISLARNYPEVGTGLLRILASRFRAIIDQYEDLLSRPVCARTAKIVLDLSEQGNKPIDRRHHSNQELAARAATGPEVFSRSLKKLRELDVIDCTRAEITVRHPGRLAEVALLAPEAAIEFYSNN
jgi:CRP-like cAMP-binding protein